MKVTAVLPCIGKGWCPVVALTPTARRLLVGRNEIEVSPRTIQGSNALPAVVSPMGKDGWLSIIKSSLLFCLIFMPPSQGRV